MTRESVPALFSNLANPHVLLDAETGVVFDANREFLRLVDRDAAAVRGEPLSALLTERETGRDVETVLGDGSGDESDEWTLRAGDGEETPVEVSHSRVTIDGEEYVLVSVRDISTQRAYERELEEYRRRLESAMLAGDVAWWEMDVRTGAVEFHENKTDMLGYDAAEFTHYEDFTELVHEDDYEPMMDAMRDALEGRASKYDTEYRIRTADGEYRWFHDVGGISQRADDGTPQKATGIVVDVTERKRAQTELEHKTQQLALLNRIVRHDIRNDMAVVSGWLELLREDLPAERQEKADSLLERVEHTIALTETVRDVVELILDDADSFETRPIGLRRVLTAEVERIEESFPSVEVVTDEIPDVTVAANEMLSSVFGNLLTNAVVHNDADAPRIEVRVDERDDGVVVSVADEGPGIPDERKARLFSYGEKGELSEGTGVGLYLVDQLVSAYGGDVWVEDNEPRGAVFRVELPTA